MASRIVLSPCYYKNVTASKENKIKLNTTKNKSVDKDMRKLKPKPFKIRVAANTKDPERKKEK